MPFTLSIKYKENGQAGMVNIWFHHDHFVLTWEECKDGDQYNECNYTRDEALEFSDVDSVVRYLSGSGIDVGQFRI